MATLTPSEKAEKYADQYEKNEINLIILYEKAMKLLDYQLEQVKHALIGDMAYLEGQKRPPEAKLIKMNCDLAKTIKQCTDLHLKITKEDLKRAGSRTLEDKIQYLVRFLKNLPQGHREAAINQISEALMLRIERKLPNGRTPNGYVHPMDKS